MNIRQAILQAKQESGKPGHQINNGECSDFLARVVSLMGGYSDILTDGVPDFDCGLPGHYWIEYQGKFYDAECPNGVPCWSKLPIFRRYYKTEFAKLQQPNRASTPIHIPI